MNTLAIVDWSRLWHSVGGHVLRRLDGHVGPVCQAVLSTLLAGLDWHLLRDAARTRVALARDIESDDGGHRSVDRPVPRPLAVLGYGVYRFNRDFMQRVYLGRKTTAYFIFGTLAYATVVTFAFLHVAVNGTPSWAGHGNGYITAAHYGPLLVLLAAMVFDTDCAFEIPERRSASLQPIHVRWLRDLVSWRFPLDGTFRRRGLSSAEFDRGRISMDSKSQFCRSAADRDLFVRMARLAI